MKVSRSGWQSAFAFMLVLHITEPALGFDAVLDVGGQAITVVGELGRFDLDVQQERVEAGLDIVRLTLGHRVGAVPPRLTLKWSQASDDMAGVWTPDISASKTIPPDWREIDNLLDSMLTRQAPVFALFGTDDINRLTVAVSDAVNPVKMDARVREEDAMIHYSIDLFAERHKALRNYAVEIRFDRRDIPYYSALRDLAGWWASKPGYAPAPVPDIARQAMYSTWYSYHQNIDFDSMLAEVRAGRKIGLQAIIVDDGWQTLDSSRGYAYVGDWKPERLSNIREFVEAVHAEGMKALLWYSVPFIGEKSKAFKEFKGKFLEYIPDYGAYVLDPRYPEVRRYLIDIYRHAIKDWNWDGLKLDFIDRFRTQDDTVLEAIDGRDYASVYEAVDRLMTDIIMELRKINPDVAIEFRQAYIGPKLRTYGNMFRAHDSPNLAFVNRGKIVDLRLLSGNTAVHSDMLMWHYDEPVEIAALQLLNVLFSVPQVSVRLDDIPRQHIDMLRFYIDYWRSNRDVLLDGSFDAYAPLMNYPAVSSHTDKKRIVALYDDRVLELNQGDGKRISIDIVNAKNSRRIVLDVTEDMGSYEVLVRNCLGAEQSRHSVEISKGVIAFDAPASGLVSLMRRQ